MLEWSIEDDVSELHAEPGPPGGGVTHVHQHVVEYHTGLDKIVAYNTTYNSFVP